MSSLSPRHRHAILAQLLPAPVAACLPPPEVDSPLPFKYQWLVLNTLHSRYLLISLFLQWYDRLTLFTHLENQHLLISYPVPSTRIGRSTSHSQPRGRLVNEAITIWCRKTLSRRYTKILRGPSHRLLFPLSYLSPALPSSSCLRPLQSLWALLSPKWLDSPRALAWHEADRKLKRSRGSLWSVDQSNNETHRRGEKFANAPSALALKIKFVKCLNEE